MVRRLKARSFQAVLHTADVSNGVPEAALAAGVPLARAADGTPRFDCVALLNVLDRCDTPRTLLAQLRDLLMPGSGRLLLAVVLPFRPFVEDGTSRRAPAEQLGLPPNGSFEASLSQLWTDVLQPLGAGCCCMGRAALSARTLSCAPVCGRVPHRDRVARAVHERRRHHVPGVCARRHAAYPIGAAS
jgi:hypothetical protein